MEIVKEIALPQKQEEAFELQRRLAGEVSLVGYEGPLRTVAAVDVAYAKTKEEAYAAAIIVSYPDFEDIEQAVWWGVPACAYQSGLFASREAPCLIEALLRLSRKPDLLLVDGQGIAHPRGFGLACHLGLVFDLPSIGCAKTHLIGDYEEPTQRERGASSPLKEGEQTIGYALRTQTGVRPIFVSPGHRIDHESALHWSLALSPTYRIPEPLRRAHHLSIELRAQHA